MRERERGRAGKRRNQILKDRIPSSLFGKLYQGDYLCIRGWWKKWEGSELGHRAKAERKMKNKPINGEAINFPTCAKNPK